jgi:hypothetical protein
MASISSTRCPKGRNIVRDILSRIFELLSVNDWFQQANASQSFTPIIAGATLPKSSSTLGHKKVRFAPSPIFPRHSTNEHFPLQLLKTRVARLSFSDCWGASCWGTKVGGRDLTWNLPGCLSRLNCIVRKCGRKWWERLEISYQMVIFILHNFAQRERYSLGARHPIFHLHRFD